MNDGSEFWQALREYNMKTYSDPLSSRTLEFDNLVEIWGKPNCPYCERAKQMCKKFDMNYIYHQLDEDFTREELLERFPDAKTFPQIIVNGEYVGGHDDFVKYKNTVLKDD